MCLLQAARWLAAACICLHCTDTAPGRFARRFFAGSGAGKRLAQAKQRPVRPDRYRFRLSLNRCSQNLYILP